MAGVNSGQGTSNESKMNLRIEGLIRRVTDLEENHRRKENEYLALLASQNELNNNQAKIIAEQRAQIQELEQKLRKMKKRFSCKLCIKSWFCCFLSSEPEPENENTINSRSDDYRVVPTEENVDRSLMRQQRNV